MTSMVVGYQAHAHGSNNNHYGMPELKGVGYRESIKFIVCIAISYCYIQCNKTNNVMF